MISPVAGSEQPPIVASIAGASRRSGVNFDYLLRTAMRESSLDPSAKAGTSSATGLYQFIDQTWLAMIARHGSQYGLDTYSDAIKERGDGRYFVADPAMRREILALRNDPEISAVMAGELANENRAALEQGLGRRVSNGEVYAAHFMGAENALTLIRTAERNPYSNAADIFPEAAASNRPIFYGHDGEARNAAQVLAAVTQLPDAGAPDVVLPGAGQAPYFAETLRGSFDPEIAPPRDVREVYAIVPEGALILSPGVVQILSSLNPLPDKAGDGVFGERDDEQI